MKKRLDIRIAEELRDGIDVIVARDGHTLTTVVERYVKDGLARDNGELMEQSTLPLVSETVRREVNQAFGQLYDKLSVDLQKSARRSDDRLSALIVKMGRSSGIGQRMLYALISKLVDPKYAAEAYESAKELTGKDLARPDEK